MCGVLHWNHNLETSLSSDNESSPRRGNTICSTAKVYNSLNRSHFLGESLDHNISKLVITSSTIADINRL